MDRFIQRGYEDCRTRLSYLKCVEGTVTRDDKVEHVRDAVLVELGRYWTWSTFARVTAINSTKRIDH